MKLNSWILAGLGVAAVASVLLPAQPTLYGQSKADKSAVAGANQIAGLGSISGSVRAPKDFKAAKVFAHNVEKNVTYMVYTEGGRYTVVDLFPGNYEVTVAKNGFSSEDVEKVTVPPGRHGHRRPHPAGRHLPPTPAEAQRRSQERTPASL